MRIKNLCLILSKRLSNKLALIALSYFRVYFLIVCTFLFAACSKTSDEAQIKLILENLSQAVTHNKLSSVANSLDKDFRANGEMDVQQVKQMLAMYGMQHQSINITIVSSKTVIDSVYQDKAESTLSVIATGSSGGMLPDDGSVRVVKLEWRKDGDWKILKANWQE